MYDDRLEAYQFQQSHILDDMFFEFLIDHGASAILHDNDLPVESLDIGQGFDQHLRLIQIFLH